MIRPLKFSANSETLSSNTFQSRSNTPHDISMRALNEFESLVQKLKTFGIEVVVYDGVGESPDELFPNNWITLFEDIVVISPMQSLSRRKEKRSDIISDLSNRWSKKEILDLSYLEHAHFFLEGTGSLILDRHAREGFACLSPRTTREAIRVFSEALKFKIHEFTAIVDRVAVYHTNVLMSLGERTALICLEAIADPIEREKIASDLSRLGKTVISLSLEQLHSFAGNALQLKNSKGKSAWVMSERAYRSLTDSQRLKITDESEIIYSDLQTIETWGGGSARCMICEIF